MAEFFICAFWALVCYLYAKNEKQKNHCLDIEPFNYAIGGFLFGIFSFLWCWNKVRLFKKNHHCNCGHHHHK